MRTRTIDKLRAHRYPPGKYYVYVFRANEDILYIGSYGKPKIAKRVDAHIRFLFWGNQLLQAAMKANKNSDQWCVDFYSAQDIFDQLPGARRDYYVQLSSRGIAEILYARDMRYKFEYRQIMRLSPAYNKDGKKSDYALSEKVAIKYLPDISDHDLAQLRKNEPDQPTLFDLTRE